MPWQELEEYIKVNGHLRNVPSAAEIKEKGQNLGELQVVQMEKIEENVLYMIEMKKEIVSMKKEIAELKKKLNKK